MAIRPLKLKEFLAASNLQVAKEPPWVHSTSSHNIWNIVENGHLLATPCSVFQAEKLCYCFVGRPAYKQDDDLNPSDWMLPIAFVLRFDQPLNIKRIFPFDSGAFVRKRLPKYITLFDLDGFDISEDRRNIGRLISLSYRTPKRYVERRAAGYEDIKDEHDLTPRHQEILAVQKLALENSTQHLDDRAAAIEISISEDIPLLKENLLGIVLPDEYRREKELWDKLKNMTPYLETYRHAPISLYAYYGMVYDGVRRIYDKYGIRL